MAVQINGELFATPVSELIGLASDVLGAIELANDAKNKANDIETDVNTNIKPNTDKVPEIDTRTANVTSRVDDIEYKKLAELFQKYGTLDAKLVEEIQRIERIDDDVADIKPKTSKMFSWLGTALDTLDVVGFVVDLIASSALAAAIVTVGANSLARDEELGIRIDNLNAMLEQYFQSLLNGQSTLLERTLLLSIILDKNNDILSSLGSLSSSVSSVKNRLDSYQEYIELLDDIDSRTIDTLTEVRDILPGIKAKVCLALQDCPPPALNSILEQIADVRSILGSGDLNCGDVFFAGNISHGLEAIYCGLRSGNIEIDLPDVNVDLSPVLNAIQGIDSKLGLPHVCDDLGGTIQTVGQGLCLISNQNPEDFHVAPFDHEERLIDGSFLVLKFMDASLEHYPFRKSRDTYYPYQLPSPRSDLTIADIAGISLSKGNVYCWVNDLTRTDGRKIFKASFYDADVGYSQLGYLFGLTNYSQPEYGHSSRSIPGEQLTKTLRVCSAAIVSDGVVTKKFSSRDIKSYLDNL
jgi:hypothetical protein